MGRMLIKALMRPLALMAMLVIWALIRVRPKHWQIED
jgi:hypothetical protein